MVHSVHAVQCITQMIQLLHFATPNDFTTETNDPSLTYAQFPTESPTTTQPSRSPSITFVSRNNNPSKYPIPTTNPTIKDNQSRRFKL